MPSKKKTTKKSKAKKPVNKRPPVKASAAKPAGLAAEPVAVKSQPRWDIWVPVLVIVVPLVLCILYVLNRPADSVMQSSSSDTSSSSLRVVPGEEGGTSSNQASGALQPQPTGLQQTQPATQSANGVNLQAQTPTR